jgi:hypothetical protein
VVQTKNTSKALSKRNNMQQKKNTQQKRQLDSDKEQESEAESIISNVSGSLGNINGKLTSKKTVTPHIKVINRSMRTSGASDEENEIPYTRRRVVQTTPRSKTSSKRNNIQQKQNTQQKKCQLDESDEEQETEAESIISNVSGSLSQIGTPTVDNSQIQSINCNTSIPISDLVKSKTKNIHSKEMSKKTITPHIKVINRSMHTSGASDEENEVPYTSQRVVQTTHKRKTSSKRNNIQQKQNTQQKKRQLDESDEVQDSDAESIMSDVSGSLKSSLPATINSKLPSFVRKSQMKKPKGLKMSSYVKSDESEENIASIISDEQMGTLTDTIGKFSYFRKLCVKIFKH